MEKILIYCRVGNKDQVAESKDESDTEQDKTEDTK